MNKNDSKDFIRPSQTKRRPRNRRPSGICEKYLEVNLINDYKREVRKSCAFFFTFIKLSLWGIGCF